MVKYLTTIEKGENYPENKWAIFIIEFEELLSRYDLQGWVEC